MRIRYEFASIQPYTTTGFIRDSPIQERQLRGTSGYDQRVEAVGRHTTRMHFKSFSRFHNLLGPQNFHTSSPR